MSLCEHCRAEIERPNEALPAPWFDDCEKTIAGAHCEPTVWQVLKILWRRRGNYVSRDSLMTLLYADQPDDPPSDKIIDVYICRLRDLLEPIPYAIVTSYAVGWQLVDRNLVAVGAPVELGMPETGIPLPAKHKPGPATDKYELGALRADESRIVRNVGLKALRLAIRSPPPGLRSIAGFRVAAIQER